MGRCFSFVADLKKKKKKAVAAAVIKPELSACI